jgi:hypothetical protein
MSLSMLQESHRTPFVGDKWRSEEDAKLLALVEKGLGWKNISEMLPGRSELGCRQRYHKRLLKCIRNDPNTARIVKLYNQYDIPHLEC